ncbi:hypothetical protein [Microbulbifer sp. ANSA005]|uniref:hypothetical protein n=1 Tax=Microbulbifer sp. ANSA005 TaxID=3243362 RepID=UPI00404349C3
MDLDQRAAERAFRKWGKAASYEDGSGGEPIDCRVIKDQEVDGFEDEERVRVPRIELSLPVSKVTTQRRWLPLLVWRIRCVSSWRMMGFSGGRW